MLPELIRALPAAVLAGIAPGYFWARCLSSSADHAERLAYSTALSMTLVPAAALLQVRLFGTGVTLFVAVISVSVVFVAGLVAYLGLGPASHTDEPPLALPLASPGVYALVPLLAALGLMLGTTSGLVPVARSMLPIALLLLLAAR